MPVRDPTISSAVEDYAKAIYALESAGADAVTTTAIAERLGRHRRLRVGDGAQAVRARAGLARALQGRAADRAWGGGGARGHPPPPAARALPGRGPRGPVGPRARGGRGARARPLRGARGPDRRQARQPDARPARRSDPDARPRDGGDAVARPVLARARRVRHVRAHLGLRSGDAALPGRARDRARRPRSRSSRSSRSAARCSPPSATRSTSSAASSPTRCAWRSRRERRRPPC